MTSTQPPFSQTVQLTRDSTHDLATRHGLQEDTASEWSTRLHSDLETTLLDDLYNCLWLVARKDGAHIDTLHEQVIKRRSIIVAEDPRLHLVWYYDTIYIKPLPDYLLNYNIWSRYICETVAAPAPAPAPVPSTATTGKLPPFDPHTSALGFLRSYSFLIRYESDFVIAHKANLIPKYISFQKWQVFRHPFRQLTDGQVSHRYHYGQFRLSRLNAMTHITHLASFFVQIRNKHGAVLWGYQQQIWQTGQYFQRYAAPLVFVFAVLTLILSSMQVGLAARGADTWPAFVQASWGFAVATMVFTLVPLLGAVVVVAVVVISQGQYALRMRWKGKRSGQMP